MNTPSRRRATLDALSWLTATSQGSSLIATAQRMLTLQQDIQRLLPEPLASACQVHKWQDGNLLLGIPSAAHSAKLRQMIPRLVQGLQQHGWQVNEIRVRVQAQRDLNMSDTMPRGPGPEVDAAGLAAFEALQATLPEGDPVREAVEKLLRRRQASAHS